MLGRNTRSQEPIILDMGDRDPTGINSYLKVNLLFPFVYFRVTCRSNELSKIIRQNVVVTYMEESRNRMQQILNQSPAIPIRAGRRKGGGEGSEVLINSIKALFTGSNKICQKSEVYILVYSWVCTIRYVLSNSTLPLS